MSLSIGLRRGVVELAAHDPAWIRAFHDERDQILRVLGDIGAKVQHIGSTAVPGIPAKPIIDIAVAVPDSNHLASARGALETAGYFYRGEPNDKGVLFFARGPESRRTHYVHLMVHDHPKWKDLLSFRDMLLRSPSKAREYAELKRSLAARFADDRGSYTREKGRFITEALRREA